ncbi:hypothetical protein AYI69_g11369, partial [Smittium culicis]
MTRNQSKSSIDPLQTR